MNKIIPVIALFLITGLLAEITHSVPANAEPADELEQGKALYDYYCYQCHGYSGDGNTLASTYLDPAPRNFTKSDPSRLTPADMIDAVSHGKPGTGMVSFTRVLKPEEIESVVNYIRQAFMQETPRQALYHSAENGWLNHYRYAAAFPFASGEIPLDTAWDSLSDNQRRGKQLYMNACISCHDRAKVQNEGPVWELRALSFPRNHYSHKRPVIDAVSGASPYAIHDQIPVNSHLDDAARRGEQLFQKNCAFCHAADGTGRNWIGSFLESRPRDLTGHQIKSMNEQQLQETILNGLPGTSMPAWRNVLNKSQISDIIAYIRQGIGLKNLSAQKIPADDS